MSLVIGMASSLMLMLIGFAVGTDRITSNHWLFGLFIAIFGFVLMVHCFDTFRNYKKHRIIKIEKTDTHRIVHKK